MQAKLFDPFTEQAVNAWLAAAPAKVIHSAQLFDSGVGGAARRVALVLYEEEREIGGGAAAPPPAEHPLFDLLDPFVHPEREPQRSGSPARSR